MAINPIPPGGIVSVPDETGGAGAATVTSQIINAKWEQANALLNAALEYTEDANLELTPTPQLAGVSVTDDYIPPLKPILPEESATDGQAIYNEIADELHDEVVDGFVNFMQEWFPDPTAFNAALAWCVKTLTVGGTGISVDAESALWERGRARIAIDNARASAEATMMWANRKYTLPPGALVHTIQKIGQDARDKLAEVNRDITVKSFDAEVENARFAVKEVLDLRSKAMDSALSYIKTLMLAPQTAADVARTLTGLRSDLARNLVALYSAEANALQPRVQLALGTAEIELKAQMANLDAKTQNLAERVKAALGNAEMVAKASSASLNGISASASIQGSDSSSV